MAKKKFKWTDVEDIAFRLIDEHPNVNPMRLKAADLKNYVTDLPEFSDDPKKAKDSILESIQKTWFDERSEMEDELGPLGAVEEEEELDEDDYRDDKMIDEESEVGILEDDDDEDEDEFEDGFQEEEIEERH